MKKAIFLITALTLCLVLFLVGCSDADEQSAFCRVLCVKDDGIIVWIENTGNVYVKHVDPALAIEPLDTVVMEFSEGDLKSTNGTFIDFFGAEQRYLYILENPGSIRYTSEEEPTFG